VILTLDAAATSPFTTQDALTARPSPTNKSVPMAKLLTDKEGAMVAKKKGTVVETLKKG
jgi:hypothetical protein